MNEAHRSLFKLPIDAIYAAKSPPDPRPFWLRFPGNVLQEIMPDFAREVEWLYVPSGHVLFEQGDEGNSAYTIVNGRVRIVASDETGAELFKAERGRGAIFGEIAMLTRGQPRTATVYAIRDTELAKIGRDGFERMAVKHPEFGLSITRMITGSFLESINHEYQPSQLTTLAVMPAHQSVPLDKFVERLAEGLAKQGSVTVLNGERFDDIHGQGASQLPADHEMNSKLVAWLTEIESIHDFVILATDDALSAWTRRCLRTADRTLIVANADESPELTPIERELHDFMDARITSGRELVLVHSTRGTLPAGSRRWLEGRYLTRHHHLHMDTPGDFARLSRLLAGQAIGLALSGGGARGLAHIGVVRALEEAGIPIDAIGGTSFGALVGASLGLEWDWQQMYGVVREFIKNRGKYFRPALPFVSLLEGRNLSQLFQHLYGEAELEDLWRPFFCVASNLTRSRLDVLDRGLVWRAVRASISLPSVFPPVLMGKEMLVDGGVINNLPSDILKERIEGGIVLASDLTAQEPATYEYEDDLTSWKMLWSRVNPMIKTKQIPSIAKVVSETMNLASKWQRPRQSASIDVLIRVPADQYNMFDYDAHEALVELGYRTAIEALEAWER